MVVSVESVDQKRDEFCMCDVCGEDVAWDEFTVDGPDDHARRALVAAFESRNVPIFVSYLCGECGNCMVVSVNKVDDTMICDACGGPAPWDELTAGTD